MIARVFVWCRHWRLFLGLSAAIAAGTTSARAARGAEDVFPALQALLHDAVTQSPRMLDQNLTRLQAEQQMLATSSGLYPRVGLGVNYNLQYEDRSTQNSEWDFNNRYNASFTISYPLIHWGANRAEADIGRIQAEMAANNVVQAYRQLALEIRRAYLQAALDRAAVRNAQFADTVVRRRLVVLEGRVERGEVQSAVIGDARLTVEENALALDRATAALERGLRALRRLSGRVELPVESIPVGIPAFAPVTTEETAAEANAYDTQRRFQDDVRYVNADRDLATDKRRLDIYRVNQRPKLDLVTGGMLDQLTYVNDVGNRTGVTAGFVGVRVSWNIFDGYATRGRLLMARTRIQQSQDQLARLEEDLRYAATQASTDLGLAVRALTIAEGRFAGAKGSYDLVAENVERQRATRDDLDNVQLNLNNAEQQLFSARANYLNAVAGWLFSVNADPAVPASIAAPSS